ncbi:MAG: acetate kinase, partial [Senegalia sp. (in: firmicutes)]
PAIIEFLMEKEDMTIDQVNTMLNKKSGVLGISGVSSDFRDIEDAVSEGNERAQLALDKFNIRVKKYIGAYAAIMGGIDVLVFTAGVGENSPETREEICEGLEFMGINLDKEANNIRGKETVISKKESTAKVLLIPTNEELMIARDTKTLVK